MYLSSNLSSSIYHLSSNHLLYLPSYLRIYQVTQSQSCWDLHFCPHHCHLKCTFPKGGDANLGKWSLIPRETEWPFEIEGSKEPGQMGKHQSLYQCTCCPYSDWDSSNYPPSESRLNLYLLFNWTEAWNINKPGMFQEVIQLEMKN